VGRVTPCAPSLADRPLTNGGQRTAAPYQVGLGHDDVGRLAPQAGSVLANGTRPHPQFGGRHLVLDGATGLRGDLVRDPIGGRQWVEADLHLRAARSLVAMPRHIHRAVVIAVGEDNVHGLEHIRVDDRRAAAGHIVAFGGDIGRVSLGRGFG